MLWQILIIMGGCGILGIALWLASKNGSKAAQLEALKAEIRKQAEEQSRVARINSSVSNMSDADVAERLQKLSGK